MEIDLESMIMAASTWPMFLALFCSLNPGATHSLAQEISDDQIRAAIDRGQRTKSKDLWREISEVRRIRWFRVGEEAKDLTFLTAADKVSLEACERKRQFKDPLSIGDAREKLSLGLLEAYLDTSEEAWSADGGVHIVLNVDGAVVQPVTQPPDSKYVPLYRTGSRSRTAWFSFPPIPSATKEVTVVVISGPGKKRERKLDLKKMQLN